MQRRPLGVRAWESHQFQEMQVYLGKSILTLCGHAVHMLRNKESKSIDEFFILDNLD